jgi:hypothetical protein
MSKSEFEEMVALTGEIDESESTKEQMKAAYENYLEIVGGEDGEELIECENCQEKYEESENTEDSCFRYASSHKGIYLVDYEADHWYGWHEGNPPMTSSYWKTNNYPSCHRWTICECTDDGDECERIGRHKPLAYPPSDDDWEEEESRELSDDEFDAENCEERGQELLVSNYKAKLGYRIKTWKENNEEKE